jgi:glutamyl-tRNA reductase
MSLVVVGTNHLYSPLRVRERISFPKKRLEEALILLKDTTYLKGAVILSTCNRVEIYASGDSEEIIEWFICWYHKLERDKISRYLYRYKGKDALRHLFYVSCGLDSLILGEKQILGQVKEVFFASLNLNFVDEVLKEAFSKALSFASEIHQKTKICKGKVSVGSVAVDFLKRKLGGVKDKKILILGIGKVTGLILRYLKKETPQLIFLSNRNFEKAQVVASQINAKAVRFSELKKFLKIADIVISATSSPHFLIKKEIFDEVKREKRLIILDLALPRDVDPKVKEIGGVELFHLEDLKEIIEKNKKKKEKEAKKAKEMIEKEVQKIWEKSIVWAQEKALLL